MFKVEYFKLFRHSALLLSIVLVLCSDAFAKTLSTNFDTNISGHNGMFFDVTAKSKRVFISGFDLNMDSSGTVTLWVREGTSQGFEDNAAGWSQIDSVAVATESGISNVDLGGVIINPGETKGFLLISSNNLSYRGFDANNSVFNNDDIRLEAVRSNIDSTPFTGGLARVFSGSVHYSVESATTPPHGNQYNGIYFDIEATDSDILFRGLEALLRDASNMVLRLDYKHGSYKGSEETPGDFVELGSTPSLNTSGIESVAVMTKEIVIPAGQTYGFALYKNAGSGFLRYRDAVNPVNQTIDFTDFTLFSDTAMGATIFDELIAQRAFAGQIFYDKLASVETSLGIHTSAATGFYLNVTAKSKNVRIEGIATAVEESTTGRLYYNPGGVDGTESNAGDWSLVTESGFETAAAFGITEIPGTGVTIPAGETYGLYIVFDCVGTCLKYFHSPVPIENSALILESVASRSTSGGDFSGSLFSPRGWKGVLRYSTGDEEACFLGVTQANNVFSYCL